MKRQKQKLKNKLLSISHHRNGVGGAGFYVALFESPWVDWTDWPVVPKGPNKNVFQVIYFPDEDAHYENIAVTNVALTSQGHISFFNNSWRGADAWGEDMIDAVDKFEKKFRNQRTSSSQQMKRRMRQTDRLQGRIQLKNRNVVITGTVPGKTRSQLAAALKELGGTLQSGVTKETDVVIKAQKPGKSKIDKAKKYGIPIVLFQTVSHRF